MTLLQKRRTGILLHPTSLPGHFENGDLGHEAFRFVDFLAEAGVSIWQLLPLGPTHEDRSPYSCLSTHAGSCQLISLSWLQDRKLLAQEEDISTLSHRQGLNKAAQVFFSVLAKTPDVQLAQDFREFTERESAWLVPYARFMTLRDMHAGAAWTAWPEKYRRRNAAAMEQLGSKQKDSIDLYCFEQFVFNSQWQQLREYAASKGVFLFGDIPIFVSHDSADVWSQPELFQIDSNGQAIQVAGVPPDYFSETGQRWGNPQYDWDAMQKEDFAWWLERFRRQEELFDVLRIDHFRGFEAVWSIDAEEETAMNGKWVKVPGQQLLERVREECPRLELVAEDLGIITDEVDALREQFGLPGMKILHFAFDGNPGNPYLPHNHVSNCVVYTGTHDNDTTIGWFNALSKNELENVTHYLGCEEPNIPTALFRTALSSVAKLAILPMQDVLALDSSHRMNIPGTTEGNWRWRFDWEQLSENKATELHQANHRYDRL